MPPPTKNIVPKLLPWSVRVNQPLPVRVPLTTRATAIAENAEERARKKKENLGELIYINDPRKIRRTTGQPLKPTERRGGKVSKKLITEIIGYAKKYNIDPNEAVARAIIESEGNPSYNNPFRILYNPENPETNPHGNKVMNSYASGVEAGLVFVKQKEDEFNRLVKKGKISPENRDLLRLQIYNGLGKLFPDTEGAKGWMYGVKIPEEGLKMTDNPLYAKELLDIVDIVKANPEIQSIVKSTQPTKTTTQYGPLKNKVYVEPKEFGKGGEVKNNKYSSIPRTGLRYPNIVRLPLGQRSFYDPVEETIYLADGEDPTVVQHEMFHHWQKLNNNLSVGPVNKPPIMSADPGSFYNRRQADIEDASSKFFKKNPSFLNIPFDLVFNKEVDPAMYYYPEYVEGEAEEYQNYINQGGEPVFPSYAKGGLIKRADGSYSKRGLWDNIRANRGSGRRPTKEMLRQERKIRAAEKKEDGGPVYNWIPPNYPRVGARNEHGGWLDQYEYGGSIEDQRIPTPAQYEFGLKYADNNSPTLTTNQMGTPRAYAHGATVFTKQTTPAWVAGTPTPTTTQREIAFNRSFSPGTAVPYPEVKIPASAYTPASPPVLQGYNPYNGPMRLHAPDTTQIARHGGRVTKKAGIPYAIHPGTSDAGMYVGPTTQRGITFANGGWLNTYEDGGETTSSLINQALNEARPQASTTSTNVPFVAQALNTAFNQEQDYLKLSEEAFQQKYGKGKHKYKYDTDPTYKAEVDKHVKAVEKSGQPVVKKTVKVNPNLMFMVPSRGYTPETAQALVDANLETIGTVLPVPGLEAVGKIPSLLSVASKAVAPIKAGIKEGVGIYKDYYQLNKLFNQQHDVQTQLNNLYHPLHGDETSPFMQTRLAEYHLKKKYDAYQSRKYPYFSSTFDFTGSPKGVLSSSTMPAFADLDRAIEVRSKQLLEEQKLQGMGAKASNDIITYRTPTPLVYATKHGKGNMINLKTGEVVPVSVEPAGETINFSKTGEVAVNGYKPSFINPNLKNTLKDNIDWVENASGGKVFGSARGVADVNLPHLPNDLEVLITRDDYNTKVAGKIGKVSKEGKAITHSLDNNAGDFDFVIIDADNKGFATGDRAAELFRQFDPDAYFEASRKALKEGKPMIIPYTPKQLLDKVDPKVKTVMDAMEIDATNIIKQKHVNRPDAYIAYGDPAIVEEAQTKFIQALVGKKGKVAPTFDPAEFSNPEKNLRILEEIGFKGDVQAIIKDPKRMQLAINDYYINTTVLSRGVRKVHSNTGKKLTLEEVEQAFKVWDPEAGGGMMRGAGQNHVVLGKSGEYDFYGHKQIGLDLPTNNVENFVTSLKKQTDGLGKLSDEERNAAKDILAAYADNDRYKNIIPGTADDFINAVAGGVPKDKMKEALAKFSEATGKKVTITSDYGNSLYASTLKDFDETLDALEFNVSNQVPTPTSRTSRQYAMADPNSFSVDPAILALNRKTQDQFKLLYNKINDGVNKTSERLEKLKATHKNLYDALFNPEKEKARIKAVSRARNKELYEKLDKVEAEIVERTKTLDALKSRIAKAQKYSNAIQLGSVGIAAAIAVPIFDKASDAFSEWQRKGIDRRAKRIRELKARRNKKGLQNPPNKPTSNTNSGWLDTLQTK